MANSTTDLPKRFLRGVDCGREVRAKVLVDMHEEKKDRKKARVEAKLATATLTRVRVEPKFACAPEAPLP